MDEFILGSKERLEIFKILSENKKLNFNKISELTKIHSNKLSYQLNLMKEKDFVVNEEGSYSLSMHAQKLLPYFSQILKKEVGVLPVILGIVRNKEKILLIKRRKMPYKDYWGLFGGKQINGETIAETIEREIFEEAKINAKMEKINGIVYERLVEKKEFKHSFLLIITTLNPKTIDAKEQDEGAVQWFDYEDVLNGEIKNIIPSDLEFLKRYSDKKIEIEHLVMNENGEKLELK